MQDFYVSTARTKYLFSNIFVASTFTDCKTFLESFTETRNKLENKHVIPTSFSASYDQIKNASICLPHYTFVVIYAFAAFVAASICLLIYIRIMTSQDMIQRRKIWIFML